MKVLVVDDNYTQRNVLEKVLFKINSEIVVRSASNGFEAFEIIEKGYLPDIILTDYNMPGLNGPEFIKVIRKDESTKTIPVVVISSEQEKYVLVETLRAGADQYLVQPFTLKRVAAVMDKALKNINSSVLHRPAPEEKDDVQIGKLVDEVDSLKLELERTNRRFDELVSRLELPLHV